MSLRLEDPLWLVLALVALPGLFAAVRWLHAMSRLRAWSVGVARAALFALLALALAGAAAVRSTDRLTVIAVVDVSESVRRFGSGGMGSDGKPIDALSAARDFLLSAAEQRGPDDLVGVVAFDGASLAVAAPRAADPGDLNLDVRRREGTNIAGAIEFASALFPPGASRRLVLISDGAETSGDALASIDALTRAGRATPIDVAPIVYSVRKEAYVESVDAPPSAAEKSAITLRIALQSSERAGGTVRVLRDGEEVDINGAQTGMGRRVEFGPGRRIETALVPLLEGRVHRFEAVFEPDADTTGAPLADTIASNNRGEAFTITPGAGSALLVDGVSRGDPSGAGRTLARTLERGGVRVRVVAPDAIPSDPLSLQAYDLVLLENVAAEEVPEETQQALRAWVHDLGGGLVMIGGPDSFGAGGWKGSALEPILPVRLDLPEQLIVPSAALMIVMDSSGSMRRSVMGGTRTQQQVANEGAALAVRALDKRDLIGVIEFNNDWSQVVPLGPNEDPKATAARIRAIAPGGGTNIYPALGEAGAQLAAVDAKVKHVILLTDGVSQGDAADGIAIVGELAAEGITVSTIAVGDGADVELLRTIARMGGGQFYQVTNPTTLPRVFLKETRVVRKPLVREAPFAPVDLASGSPITLGMPPAAPNLLGLALTRDRDQSGDGATVVRAMATPTGEPLLAHWSVGLGQVAAWTSDASAWSKNWIPWPGFATMWTQLAKTISRPAFGREYDTRVAIEGDELSVRIGAFTQEGEPLDLLAMRGTLYRPDGSSEPITLAQTGPGQYGATIPAVEAGSYVVTVAPRQGARALAPIVAGAAKAEGPETRRLSSNVGLLRAIAEKSGGRVLDLARPDLAAFFDREGMEPSRASLPLWRLLLVWAVVALVLDVATRRVAWDRFDLREVAAEARRLASLRKTSGARAPSAVGALRKAKGRAAERSTAPRGKESLSDAPIPLAPPVSQAERLRAIRQQMREAGRAASKDRSGAQTGAGGASSASTTGVPGSFGADEGASSGLLAAKRRARKRFEAEREGDAPDLGGEDDGAATR